MKPKIQSSIIFIESKIDFDNQNKYIFQMSSYRKIAEEFSRAGYRQNSRLNQYEMNNALDKIVQENLSIAEFNRDVSIQLFEQTERDHNNSVLLRDFINTILTAHTILDKHIKQCESKLNQANQQERRQIIESLSQFQEDYQLLTTPFHIEAPKPPKISQQILNQSRSLYKSKIFAEEPSERTESDSLKFTLIITLCSFLVEIICTFARHHFFGLLAYTAILSIFFLNYFDRYTIRICLGLIAASFIFDLLWIFLESDPYWNSNGQTQHSTLQPGFLKTVYIFTIILMLSKALLFAFLYRFKNNEDRIQKIVRLYYLKFQLDGSAENNPISAILTGKRLSNPNGPYAAF